MSTSLKARFTGLHAHRYREHPLERAFAGEWQKLNDEPRQAVASSRSAFAYLMDITNQGNPVPPLSKRDWLVAATVIQWLGSPVGQDFLRRALFTPGGRELREALTEAQQAKEKLLKHAGKPPKPPQADD